MNLNSYFADIFNCKSTLGIYNIPWEWWSRRFEYPWASQFVRHADKVIDAACGVPHFFKYWLADNCDSVLAVDADPELANIKAPNNMEVHVGDIANMPAGDMSTDVVFCISVLEHVPPAQRLPILAEFARVLKPQGLAIISVDVPSIGVNDYIDLIKSSPLQFAGGVITAEPPHVLKHRMHRGGDELRVFCSVLVRRPQ